MPKGRSMSSRSEGLWKMAFKRLKAASLFPSENQKQKSRGEMVPCRGFPTTTVIDIDGEMAPPQKERRTRELHLGVVP